jgi:hypothetical protein
MRFRIVPGGRWGGIASVGVFWTVGLVLTVWGRSSGVPIWFRLLWLAGAAAAGYPLMFRQALELRLEAGFVTAIYALRTRRVPMSSLVQMRPSRNGWNSTIIEVRDEPSIIAVSTHRLGDFAAALRHANPDLPIKLNWLLKIDNMLSGRNRP